MPHGLIQYAGGERLCVWWHFSLGALEGMVRGAGFHSVDRLGTFRIEDRSQHSGIWHAIFRCRG